MLRRLCLAGVLCLAVLMALMLLAGCTEPAPPLVTSMPASPAPAAKAVMQPATPAAAAPTAGLPAGALPRQPAHGAASSAATAGVAVTEIARPQQAAGAAQAGLPAVAPANSVPTPQAPTDVDRPGAQWTVKEERVVGPYAVRLWHDEAGDMPWGDTVTISAAGRPQIVITGTLAIGDQTGKDLTGEGQPEIVVETYSGGAHCCFGTRVYQAGPVLKTVLAYEGGNCSGQFADLNNDGAYEFVTCDDSFAYAYCPFAGSPMVRVIYQYRAGSGDYRPASPKFQPAYDADIKKHSSTAREGRPGEAGEWDNTNKCSVLPLVLDYLYSGQTNKAWLAFDEYYRGPDAQKFRGEIENTVSRSSRFITA